MPVPSGRTVAFDSALTDFTFKPSGRRMCSVDQAAVEFSAKVASPVTCEVAGVVLHLVGNWAEMGRRGRDADGLAGSEPMPRGAQGEVQPVAAFHHEHVAEQTRTTANRRPLVLPVAAGLGGAGLLPAFLAPGVKRRAVIEHGVEILGRRIAVSAGEMRLGHVVQRHRHPHSVTHPAETERESTLADVRFDVPQGAGDQLMIGLAAVRRGKRY